jgi:cobalamin biosynthesis protein CobT
MKEETEKERSKLRTMTEEEQVVYLRNQVLELLALNFALKSKIQENRVQTHILKTFLSHEVQRMPSDDKNDASTSTIANTNTSTIGSAPATEQGQRSGADENQAANGSSRSLRQSASSSSSSEEEEEEEETETDDEEEEEEEAEEAATGTEDSADPASGDIRTIPFEVRNIQKKNSIHLCLRISIHFHYRIIIE